MVVVAVAVAVASEVEVVAEDVVVAVEPALPLSVPPLPASPLLLASLLLPLASAPVADAPLADVAAPGSLKQPPTRAARRASVAVARANRITIADRGGRGNAEGRRSRGRLLRAGSGSRKVRG